MVVGPANARSGQSGTRSRPAILLALAVVSCNGVVLRDHRRERGDGHVYSMIQSAELNPVSPGQQGGLAAIEGVEVEKSQGEIAGPNWPMARRVLRACCERDRFA